MEMSQLKFADSGVYKIIYLDGRCNLRVAFSA